MSYDGEGHAYDCECAECTGLDKLRDAHERGGQRIEELEAGVRHVLRHGKLGKQSKLRLRSLLGGEGKRG